MVRHTESPDIVSVTSEPRSAKGTNALAPRPITTMLSGSPGVSPSGPTTQHGNPASRTRNCSRLTA